MSGDLYFACRWVMRPVKPRDAFFRLFKAAELAKIELRVSGVQLSDNNEHFLRFIVRTPSRETLNLLLEHIGHKMGLNVWTTASEADFAGAALTLEAAKDLSDAAQVYGQANEKRRKKAARKKAESGKLEPPGREES